MTEISSVRLRWTAFQYDHRNATTPIANRLSAVIAPITNAVSYPNPNLAATALVDPEIRDDPGIYPPPQVMQRLYIDEPAPRAYERARTRVWNRVKSGC